uniref:Uncharacterized protein n=1 Tax=Arundo donax TaxID=35708 RepID=A0A0A9C9U4_ARUDO
MIIVLLCVCLSVASSTGVVIIVLSCVQIGNVATLCGVWGRIT